MSPGLVTIVCCEIGNWKMEKTEGAEDNETRTKCMIQTLCSRPKDKKRRKETQSKIERGARKKINDTRSTK